MEDLDFETVETTEEVNTQWIATMGLPPVDLTPDL